MCGTAAWETEAGGDKQPVRDGLSMVPKELLRIFNAQFKFVSGVGPSSVTPTSSKTNGQNVAFCLRYFRIQSTRVL